MNNKPILCLDFDGVCHAYTSGWQGATVIPDDAVPGLFEFLEQVAPYFSIAVFSSRSDTDEGRNAMLLWFYEQRKKWRKQGGKGSEVIEIAFPEKKPAAFITLDDRAVSFHGRWPDVNELKSFLPWYKRAALQPNCLDCGKPYSEFGLDLTLPDAQWQMIHPEKDGLLCAGCIVKRASRLSNVVAVRASWDWQTAEHPGKPTNLDDVHNQVAELIMAAENVLEFLRPGVVKNKRLSDATKRLDAALEQLINGTKENNK